MLLGGAAMNSSPPHHMHGESVAAYIQEIQCGGIERISVNGETKVMSIGYAMYPEDGTNLEALTRKTDKAMYNAKNLKLAT